MFAIGYDASLISFDENELICFMKAFKKGENQFREYMKMKHSPGEEKITEMIKNVNEDSADFLSGKWLDSFFAMASLHSLEKIGKAKIFGIPGLRHYEFGYFWKYMKGAYANCKDDYEYISRYVTGANAKSYRATLPKGMLVFESLFREPPPEFFRISLEGDDYFVGYANAESLQKSGRDAVGLIEQVRISHDEPILMEFLELEAGTRVSEDWLEAFREARDVISSAIAYSVEKNYGLVLLAE